MEKIYLRTKEREKESFLPGKRKVWLRSTWKCNSCQTLSTEDVSHVPPSQTIVGTSRNKAQRVSHKINKDFETGQQRKEYRQHVLR